jgi:hypothetical protein
MNTRTITRLYCSLHCSAYLWSNNLFRRILYVFSCEIIVYNIITRNILVIQKAMMSSLFASTKAFFDECSDGIICRSIYLVMVQCVILRVQELQYHAYCKQIRAIISQTKNFLPFDLKWTTALRLSITYRFNIRIY